MVRQKAGDKKKQLILDTCKKLFYQKGYANTTYVDICHVADIPPGSITYHFSSKAELASIIDGELEAQNKTYIEEMCGDRYTKTELMVIENYHMWKRIFEDGNIRRFLSDLSMERLPNCTAANAVQYFYECVINERGIEVDENQLRLMVYTQIGMSDGLLAAITEHYDDFTYEEVAEFGIYGFLMKLDFTPPEIEGLIKHCKPIFDSLPIDNRYYKNFAYDKKYLKRLDD